MNRIVVAALAVWVATQPLFAQEKPLVLKGATIYPIVGAVLEQGSLIVQGGKIIAVGKDLAIPAGATVMDVTGKVVMPGLVDTHSHVGGGDGGDRSAPIQPEIRVLDAIDVRNDTLKKAKAGGITTVNVMPDSGHLLSGQTAYLKLRGGANTIDDLLFCKDALKEICGGIKMANGTNSIGEPPFPGTRAKSASLVRQMFIKAQQYRAKIEKAKGDASKLPDRDFANGSAGPIRDSYFSWTRRWANQLQPEP
jgi:imidazolonepropionase-like amidohydrolase